MLCPQDFWGLVVTVEVTHFTGTESETRGVLAALECGPEDPVLLSARQHPGPCWAGPKPGSSSLGSVPPSRPSLGVDATFRGPQARAARTGRGLPAQLGPVLEPVPLRFGGILPWRPGTPQLRL